MAGIGPGDAGSTRLKAGNGKLRLNMLTTRHDHWKTYGLGSRRPDGFGKAQDARGASSFVTGIDYDGGRGCCGAADV
jgi:hypothetical protein